MWENQRDKYLVILLNSALGDNLGSRDGHVDSLAIKKLKEKN